MSIEQSMQAQADAMNNLANAMNRYASVMEAIANRDPSHIVTPPAGNAAAAETPAAAEKSKPGRKPKNETKAADTTAEPEPDAFGDDGDAFGDEPAKLTAEDIRALVLKLKDKSKEDALAVIKAVGVSTLAQIEEKDYQKVADLCAKKGVTL